MPADCSQNGRCVLGRDYAFGAPVGRVAPAGNQPRALQSVDIARQRHRLDPEFNGKLALARARVGGNAHQRTGFTGCHAKARPGDFALEGGPEKPVHIAEQKAEPVGAIFTGHAGLEI